jgi:hypothetical protein
VGPKIETVDADENGGKICRELSLESGFYITDPCISVVGSVEDREPVSFTFTPTLNVRP